MHPMMRTSPVLFLLLSCTESPGGGSAPVPASIERSMVSNVIDGEFVCRFKFQGTRSPGEILARFAPRDGRTCNMADGITILVPSDNGNCIGEKHRTTLVEKMDARAAEILFDRCTNVGAESSSSSTDGMVFWINDIDRREERVELVTLYTEIGAAAIRDALPVTSVGLRNDVVCVEAVDVGTAQSWLDGLGIWPGSLVRKSTFRQSTCNVEVPKLTGRPWQGHGLVPMEEQ